MSRGGVVVGVVALVAFFVGHHFFPKLPSDLGHEPIPPVVPRFAFRKSEGLGAARRRGACVIVCNSGQFISTQQVLSFFRMTHCKLRVNSYDGVLTWKVRRLVL